MAIQKPKTAALYQFDILQALTQTGIKQLAAGGKARAFCDIVGDKIAEMETREFLTLGETLIHYATGENLDFIGEIFGVFRLGQQIASVAQGDRNFRFLSRAAAPSGQSTAASRLTSPPAP